MEKPEGTFWPIKYFSIFLIFPLVLLYGNIAMSQRLYSKCDKCIPPTVPRNVIIHTPHQHKTWASLVAQVVKNLPAMQETFGQEDPLEKGMATHSSILAWRISRTEDSGRLQSIGSQESDRTDFLILSLFHFQSAQYK